MWGARQKGLVEKRGIPELNVPKILEPQDTLYPLVWGKAKGKG